MSSSTGTIIESLRRTAQGLPSVDVLVLFGSRAGEAVRADSDVDIAVGLSAPSAEVRRAVEVAFARAVLPTIDISFLDIAPSQLRFEITRTGRLVFERTQGAWTRERARAMLDWWDWAPLARRIHARSVARLRAQG